MTASNAPRRWEEFLSPDPLPEFDAAVSGLTVSHENLTLELSRSGSVRPRVAFRLGVGAAGRPCGRCPSS